MRAFQAPLYFALMLTFLACVASADEGSKKGSTADGPARIAFGGGNVDEYVDVVRKKFTNCNIVVDGLGGLAVPKASLERVTCRTALEWIPKTTEARKAGLALQGPQAGRNGEAVFLLTGPPVPSRAPAPSPERQANVWNLNEAIWPGVKPDLIKQAVLEMLTKRDPQFKGSVDYNSTTHILTVVGSANDLRDAQRAVEAMTQGQRIAVVLPALQDEVKKLRDRIERLESELQKEKSRTK